MSECYLARCEQDRKLIRREFNKWTKNILLQIGLETISKHHFKYEINSFNQTNVDEQIPIDFNPNQSCLFCINRQEYLSSKIPNPNKTNLWLNDETELIVNNDENSPLDLSVKSTSDLNSRSLFDIQSDILPIYNPEELLLSTHMNLDYLSQSFPNMNHFSTLPINAYQLNSFLPNDYVIQLAKQMAYLRMMQEIENQRNNKKSKITTNFFDTSSILTESMNVDHILNDIMIRTLNEIFEEQIKQQTRVSRQGELLFVKKQNNNNDDITILNTKKQHKHSNQTNPSSSSSSSSTSSISSRCSRSIHTKTKNKAISNQSSTYIPSRRPREVVSNSKVIINMDGKQTRPKRGQYRRYESEQLSKAVAAVLRNEMSVHKAGSYFGVPHSTLEYKVKERNSKMPVTTKNKNESSPSTLSVSINDNNNNISQIKPMENNNGDDNHNLSLRSQSKSGKHTSTNQHHHEIDEEIQSYIPIELEMN